MENVEGDRLLWFTYWLLIIRNRPFGAGLAGFKGFPDEAGEVEIGYGIDVACQGQGYMTEAVKRMIGWAFEEKRCLSIVARGVEKSNIASQRVLAKVGMTIYEESEATLSYRIKREEAGEL
jgi:RimJ/RimL family protein N-acetyltransferase